MYGGGPQGEHGDERLRGHEPGREGVRREYSVVDSVDDGLEERLQAAEGGGVGGVGGVVGREGLGDAGGGVSGRGDEGVGLGG